MNATNERTVVLRKGAHWYVFTMGEDDMEAMLLRLVEHAEETTYDVGSMQVTTFLEDLGWEIEVIGGPNDAELAA